MSKAVRAAAYLVDRGRERYMLGREAKTREALRRLCGSIGPALFAEQLCQG